MRVSSRIGSIVILILVTGALAQNAHSSRPAEQAGLPTAASPVTAPTQGPWTADRIMARVAENQDKAEKLRSEYIYEQRVRIVLHKPHGKLTREETANYHVTPSAEASEKKLEKLTGRYLAKGKYLDFEGEPVPEPDSLDGQLVQQFRDDFVNSKTKDGLAKDLFPLTSAEQESMEFRLVGEETVDGRAAYRVAFRPKDNDEITWAGDAWIDKEEFQPVYVTTKLSRRIPFFVRTMFGTDLPGLGFSVHYRRQPDGVWFPTSFGTEFRLRAIFFINRDIAISLENQEFERTHVKTRVDLVAPE